MRDDAVKDGDPSEDGIPFGPIEEATFLRRPNRYLAHVARADGEVAIHVPDPGRMIALLVPGRRVWIRRAAPTAVARRTEYDLVLVDQQGVLVSINTTVPNRLVRQALEGGRWPEFAGDGLAPGQPCVVRAEAVRGASRFDFELTGPAGCAIVEVKSVGLMRDGVAWFPDAVTARGKRHVEELTALRREGIRTAIAFVSQRGDVSAIRPEEAVDPAFARVLRDAATAGVELIGWRCAVTLAGIRLECRVPVEV